MTAPGTWVRRGLIRVWVTTGPAPTTPPKPDRWSKSEAARRAAEELAFNELEARRAHQAYKRGDRGEWATTGHRVYCRRTDRLRRAAA